MRWNRSLTLTVLLVASLVIGCQSAPASQGAPAGSTQSAAQSTRVLRLALNNEVPELDPATIHEPLGINIGQNLFESLTQWDMDWNIKPGVAQEWTTSADGKTWTFKLRRDAKFSNGDAITAKDFKYAWNRALWPETKSLFNWVMDDIVGAKDVVAGKTKDIAGVKVVDDYTLEVTLVKPAAYFLAQSGLWTYAPVSQKVVEQYKDRWTDGGNLVGNGPYVLKEWDKPTKLVLEANPNYFDKKPSIQRVEVFIIKEAATALLKYENNELDVVDVPTADFERISKDPALSKQLNSSTLVGTRWVTFNVAKPPFNNKAVREAFALGIDRTKVVEFGFANSVAPAHRILPPGLLGYSKDLNWPAFDVAAAKRKLAEAGYPDGKGFPAIKFAVGGDPNDRKAVENVVAQLKSNLGLDVAIEPMPGPAYSRFRADPNADKTILLGSWGNDYPDSQEYYYPLFTTGTSYNYGNWSNKQYDQLVSDANGASDPKQRVKLYTEAENLLLTDMAVVPLWFKNANWLMKADLVGFKYPPNYWPLLKYVSFK